MVRSTEGLSQEDALTSLQNHPSFKAGTKIASVYNQGGRGVAKLIEPKVAFGFDDITDAVGGAANAVGDYVDKGTQPWQDVAQGVNNAAGDFAGG